MTSTRALRACGAAAFAAMLVLSAHGACAAGPTPADLATARELYKVGMNALDANNPRGAAEKLAAAWALAPTPLIGVALAQAQEKLGQLVEARETALAVRRLEIAPGETARSSQARAEATTLDEGLATRIPHVHVTVANSREGLMVSIDGGTGASLASLAVDRPMDPGEHTIELVVSGRSLAKVAVTLAERERKEVTLTAPDEPAPPQPLVTPTVTVTPTVVVAQPQQPIDATVSTHSSTSPLVWVGGITGGVGLIAGAIFGALALNEASYLQSHCADKNCYTPDDSHIGTANTYAALSTTGFVVGGVGVAVFIVGLVLSRSHSGPPHAASIVRVNANGAAFSF